MAKKSNGAARLREWRPLSEAHAIERVLAAVRFAQPVTDIPWKKIQATGRERARKLQLITERPLQQIGFAVSPEGQGNVTVPQSVGIEFLRLERPDFYSDKLAIERAAVSFESWRYTRWVGFAERIREGLATLAQLYLTAVPLLGIQLEYIDRFDAAEGQRAPSCAEVVRHPSKFIAEGAFRDREPWHCHIGWFEKPDAQTRRLANLDVDVGDVAAQPFTEAKRTIRIRTHLTDFFNQPEFEPLSEEAVTTAFIADRFNSLHIELKEMLREVVTEVAAASISLEANS
jgi:uncharacterized protein (TIGR04255 family)